MKHNIKKQLQGRVKIQSNKDIQGTLYNNDNENFEYRNKKIFDYFVPQYVENIKYEIICKYCSLYLIINNLRIKQDDREQENNIEKYGLKLIKFNKQDDIKLYYNKIISFEISLEDDEQIYSSFNFKISLFYKGMIENILILNSEMNALCYQECSYLIPIYEYNKLNSLTISVSDNELKANLNLEIDCTIYSSISYYDYIVFSENKYTKNPKLIGNTPKSEKLLSRKNYIIYESKNQNENILILVHIKIFNDFNNIKNTPYQIYFTYSKNSRKNYFLYPNRNNLLYIDKNFESKNVKEIRIPDFFLIRNKHEKDDYNDSSTIIFNHIKGDGVVELITNNHYLHNNINKLYTELKSFIFNSGHSFFQINYNKKSQFSKKFYINSREGLYTYAKINANIKQNMNEIKLGKANYILHQYDSSPINLYIKINDLNEIENDITINIKIEGLDVYKSYNISMTGYFSFSRHLNIDLNNIKKYAISKGFYDNITNIGIIKFKSKSMKTYYSNNIVNLLIINLKDLNYNKNEFIDVMIKITPLPNQILFKDNFNEITDNYDFSIPQFEHFISYIDLFNSKYMIYKLDTMNDKNKYINVELHFLYNETEFCFHVENSNLYPDNLNFYKNDTNEKYFLIIDERNKNGKKSIVIKLDRRFKEIYLIIFMKNKIKNNPMDKDELFFSIKYYSFTNEDYTRQEYLYKNRFLINSTKIKVLINDNNYYFNWGKVKLKKLKEEKGEIKIDYYLKINNQSNKDIYYNNGLFNIFDKFNNFNYGFHLITDYNEKFNIIKMNLN